MGDPSSGEWREWSGYAFHLRRRLSGPEQSLVGPAVDIRGTDEARARARQLGHLLEFVPETVLFDELGVTA